MSNEPGYEIGVYIICCIMWIEGCLITIWTATFYRLWKLNIRAISIRRPKCVILFSILCCIGLYIRFPLQLFLSINTKKGHLFDQLFGFQTLLSFISFVGVIYIIVYKTWVVYYDIKCAQSLQDAQWIHHIDTTTAAGNDESWYIMNRKTFGNSKYVIIILLIPWLLFTTVGTTAGFIFGRHKIVHISSLISCFIPICILFVLSLKLPKYDDYYKLRKETKISSTATVICLCGGLIGFASQKEPGSWAWLILNFTMSTIIFVLVLFGLYAVFIAFNFPTLPCFVYKLKDEIMLEKNMNVNVQMDVQIDVNNCTLFDIFKDYELFTLFARHLCKEFAVEMLLFFLETQQLIECVSQYMNSQSLSNLSPTQQTLNPIECSNKLPKSTIVKDIKDLKGAIQASIQLFSKYIDSGAQFMINIPWEQREMFNEFFGVEKIKNTQNNDTHEQMKLFMIQNGIQWKDIYTVFDESRISMFKLMSHSFTRFNLRKN
eukprot:502121_1